MAHVAIPSSLPQWGYTKPFPHPTRVDSAASSEFPNDPDTEEAVKMASPKQELEAGKMLFDDRYLSSEEDLSPVEHDTDSSSEFDDMEVEDIEIVEAKPMPMSPASRPQSCDMATMVSYVSAGRPKVVDVITTPVTATAPSPFSRMARTSSLGPPPTPGPATAPLTGIQPRYSMPISNPPSRPASAMAPRPTSSSGGRRLSLGNTLHRINTNIRPSSRLSITSESEEHATPARAPSRCSSTYSPQRRPSSSKTTGRTKEERPPVPLLSQRSSSYNLQTTRSESPQTHSFLNTDPFSSDSTSSASPIINRPVGHRRLRSLSRGLALAKLAVMPSNKETNKLQKPSPTTQSLPPCSPQPLTPGTPQYAPPPTPSFGERAPGRMSRSSTTPEPPLSATGRSVSRKMVARAANERSSPIDLPPFPENTGDMSLMQALEGKKPLKKRKSVLDLLG